jgi:hypothetical protein
MAVENATDVLLYTFFFSSPSFPLSVSRPSYFPTGENVHMAGLSED